MSTRTWLTPLLFTLASSVLLAPSLSCVTLECGSGTIEQDGECRPADTDPDPADCGPGTQPGNNGVCEPILDPTICDPLTTVAVQNPDTGVIECVGVGGPGGCAGNLACPGADAGKVTVCGRFVNVEDDANIEAVDPLAMECGAGGVDEGPCEFDVNFYDALDFAGNPSGAVPLAVETLYVDDCGRFVAENITRPQLGFLGIGVDDGAGGNYELSGVAFPVNSGQVRNGQRTYVMESATNTDWSTDVSLSPTFVERGVFVSLFLYDDEPVAGVTVEDTNGARPADDYYFDDTEVLQRTSVITGGASGSTGPNGMALLLNSSLVEHTGSGAEPDGCQWPSDLAASIAGVMFFNPRHAETPAGGDCP